MSIRFKVIIPYLLLTLLVAVTGVYVVTRLVANSLSERLTNQLLESGRVVSDGLARQEIKHVEISRIVAFTRGVAEAIALDDGETVAALVAPVAAGLDAENLIVVDQQGEELVHLIEQPGGTLLEISAPTGAGGLSIVQSLLNSTDPQAPPRRGLGVNQVDGRYYYYTALPVVDGSRIIGVVLVGTSLDTILPYLKSVSLADVIIYTNDGQVIATTLGSQGMESIFLDSLSIPIEDYEQTMLANDVIQGENFSTGERWYSLARGSLQVGNDRIGVFAVVLPMDFVIQPGAASRNTYVAIFGLAMIGVVVIGILVSRLIINPLSSLVRTSQAIAQGDLNQRSGIQSTDEIGMLASTFDEMTTNLQQRTDELKRTYRFLEQMDRTKTIFIDVSAHELRSPLTLVKGYAQMMDMKANDDQEMRTLSQGLIEGIDRMTEIVNNMLDVSRIDSKVLKIVPEWLQVGTVLMRVQKTFQKGIQERKLTLSLDGISDLPSIHADPDLIYKVFYQLIMNAIKYTPDGGTVTVHGCRRDDNPSSPEIEIVVEDTGIGVAPEHQEAIFEKFFQTGEVLFHSSGKTRFKGGGSGLGLAIARGIVEAHKGRIWMESPGHDETRYPGSKFFVRLPLDGSKS